MTDPPDAVSRAGPISAAYTGIVRALVLVMAAAAGLGILAMIAVTCVDVILRIFGTALIGALDIVKLAGAVTIAGALPYTTAVKGHVAIEYFFQKLSRFGRIAVDSVARLLAMVLFGLLTYKFIDYGMSLKRSGQVTDTLQVPVFWVPYVMSVSCAVVVLVIFHNLVHPGKETIKP
jgi:TRAP-type C4-dicarboxylate transport system permease small subunit